MLRAVKLWKSSSICGPSATLKPISPKIAVSSSIVWLIGWMRPSRSGATGRVTSSRSPASRAPSSASARRPVAASIAAAMSSLSRLSVAPALLRASAARPPSPFISSVTRPLRPSAVTRTCSRASRLSAAATASRSSRRILSTSSMAVYRRKKGHEKGAERGVGPFSFIARDVLGIPSRLLAGPQQQVPVVNRRADADRIAVSRLGERGLRGVDDRLEGGRLADREVRQDLTVELDASAFDAAHELRIGHAVLTHAGIDADDPQGAEAPLLVAAVAIGILQPLFDFFDCGAEARKRTAPVALCEFENLLLAGVTRDGPPYTIPGSAPP